MSKELEMLKRKMAELDDLRAEFQSRIDKLEQEEKRVFYHQIETVKLTQDFISNIVSTFFDINAPWELTDEEIEQAILANRFVFYESDATPNEIAGVESLIRHIHWREVPVACKLKWDKAYEHYDSSCWVEVTSLVEVYMWQLLALARAEENPWRKALELVIDMTVYCDEPFTNNSYGVYSPVITMSADIDAAIEDNERYNITTLCGIKCEWNTNVKEFEYSWHGSPMRALNHPDERGGITISK